MWCIYCSQLRQHKTRSIKKVFSVDFRFIKAGAVDITTVVYICTVLPNAKPSAQFRMKCFQTFVQKTHIVFFERVEHVFVPEEPLIRSGVQRAFVIIFIASSSLEWAGQVVVRAVVKRLWEHFQNFVEYSSFEFVSVPDISPLLCLNATQTTLRHYHTEKC